MRCSGHLFCMQETRATNGWHSAVRTASFFPPPICPTHSGNLDIHFHKAFTLPTQTRLDPNSGDVQIYATRSTISCTALLQKGAETIRSTLLQQSD